jgi:hypothetical protein
MYDVRKYGGGMNTNQNTFHTTFDETVNRKATVHMYQTS